MKKKFLILTLVTVFLSCEAVFIENISNLKIILLAPSNNSEVEKGTIEFHWQELTDASEYNIQIATPNFASATQILLDSTTTINNISKDLEVGTYEWRVKAINSGYTTNYTSHSFSVK